MRQGDGLAITASAGYQAAAARDRGVMPIDDSTMFGASARHREIVHVRNWDDEPALNRLRRFVTPQLAEAIAAGGDRHPREPPPRDHGSLCDMRGFTAFSGVALPELDPPQSAP